VYTSRALHTTLCGPWSLVLLKRSEKDENPNGEKERERQKKKVIFKISKIWKAICL
jgi:hypothetical protein